MEKQISKFPYTLVERPSIPADKNSEKKIYPVAQQNKTVGLRKMARHIKEHGSSFSVGTIQGVLSDLVECTIEMLQQGFAVDYEGLCRFYVTLSASGVDSVEDFSVAHIKKANIRADIDTEAEALMDVKNIDFAYQPTREQQAKARQEAKEALGSTSGNSGSGTSGGNNNGDNNGDSGDPGDVTG